MNLLQSLKTTGKRGRGPKQPWTLGEVLSVMYMINQEGMDKSDVAKVTGRTVHQIQYHILENPIMDGGKLKKRSFKAKYFVDAESSEEAYTNLFTHFDVDYKGSEHIAELITKYQTERQAAIVASMQQGA